MKKTLLLCTIAIFALLYSTTNLKAQLPSGSVGIGSNFGSGVAGLSVAYAFSNSFDLMLNLGYTNNSQTNSESDNSVSSSQTSIGIGGRIFFSDNKTIDPFLGLGLSYSDSGIALVEDAGQDATAILGQIMIGGQSEIATNFFLYISTGIVYGSSSADSEFGNETVTLTNSVLTLGTTAVGALIYF
jgi:hypothetical protein